MQNQREEALEPPGLACNGLTLGYDGRPVIEGLDLSLPPGASLAIVGESGCGKSTTANVMCGLQAPTSGKVYFKGKDVTKRTAEDRRHMGRVISVVFQNPATASVRFRTCAQASSGSISVFFRGSA